MRSLVGSRRSESPAHLLLLTKFLRPRTKEEFAGSREWAAVLHESCEKAIGRLLRQGLLQNASIERHLDYRYKATELRAMLKQKGLPTSGRKMELTERLVREDLRSATRAVAGLTLLECSEQGRQLAEQYLTTEQETRAQVERETVDRLRQGRFQDASLLVASYEARQVFPRGLGIDWESYDPSDDVERLRAIFQAKPRRLAHLSDAQLEPVRVAVGMLALMWNVGEATTWVSAILGEGLGMPADVAVLVLASHSRFQTEIARLRRAGCTWVEIRGAGDEHVCEACRQLTRRGYDINLVPELPCERCSSALGVCRCWVVGSYVARVPF